MLQYVCDSSPEVRQAAAYGLGVMAQYGGDNYSPFCTGTSVYLVMRISPQTSLVSPTLLSAPTLKIVYTASFLYPYANTLLQHVDIYHPHSCRDGNEV